ncbi:MAG: hypothetical protein ONB13_07810 [candidate division KSB1 bacterium]|nr:hypothetical protein [candidate division KSB1 bacterium]
MTGLRILNEKYLLRVAGFFAALWLLSLFCCGEKIPTYRMVLTDFRLNIPAEQMDSYFGKVTDLDVTAQGDIIVVDVIGPGVVRFDPQGNFVNNIAGYGSGNYETLCSANPVDTLLAVHTLGLLEFFRPKGTPVTRHFLRGRGDISVASDGSFVINRMYDSRLIGYCLETYDSIGKQIATFRTPRATEQGKEYLDFAFSRVTPDHRIVYVPTTVDSGFIYDFQGNLLLARKIPSDLKPYRLKDKKPGPLVEDLYVDETGIFIVRVNKKLSTDQVVYFDLVEQYDFEFNKIAAYRFAVPLTMTIVPEVYSPWYHKFVHYNGQFFIMMSQPFEQLVVFKPVS